MSLLNSVGGMITGLSVNKIVIGITVALVGTFAAYWWYAEGRIEEMAKNEAKYEIAIKNKDDTIDKLEKDAKKLKEANAKVIESERLASMRARKLENRLSTLSRDLRTDPKKAQETINTFVSERVRCLEIASGSKVTEGDKSNSLCPELVAQP